MCPTGKWSPKNACFLSLAAPRAGLAQVLYPAPFMPCSRQPSYMNNAEPCAFSMHRSFPVSATLPSLDVEVHGTGADGEMYVSTLPMRFATTPSRYQGEDAQDSNH